MRYCGQCGAQISEKAIYCEMCGVKLFNEESSKYTHSPVDKDSQPDEPHTDVEELDLTGLDKNLDISSPAPDIIDINIDTTKEKQKTEVGKPQEGTEKDDKRMINLKDVLESEEKVEMDNSIKREVLADEEEFSKICPMCGEEMTINKKLLENAPVLVKCLKCGQETKIW